MISATIKTLVTEPTGALLRLLTDREYRAYLMLKTRLYNVPRFKECKIKLNNWNLVIPDAASFLSTFNEIFVEQIYRVRFNVKAPRILDLGANIGLSVLYFKELCPEAKITAIEADPHIFSYLERNIKGNGLADVTLLSKAAWHENTVLSFSPEGGDGGRIAWPGDKKNVEVEAVDIREIMQSESFDFLKMDIEGAEETILPLCQEFLSGIRYIFVEYHSRVGHQQHLDKVVSVLAETGFRLHIQSAFSSPSPYVDLRVHSGFDLQLNIFGWRENDC